MKQLIVHFIIGIFLLASNSLLAQDPPPPPEIEIVGEARSLLNGYLKVSSEDEKEYLKNATPKLKEYFKQIKANDERRYYQLLREYYFSNLRYPMMRRKEAELQTTQREIIEQEIMTEAFASKYKNANTDEKSKIRQDLEQSLTYLFDLKENQREYEVRELEAQLKELKDKISVRKKNKSTIIKRRMEELLGDDKFLEWE